MIVRPATLADLNACLLLDHSCVTDHVWQMKVEEMESQVSVTFRTVRLPRRMRADCVDVQDVDLDLPASQQGGIFFQNQDEGIDAVASAAPPRF